MNVAHRVACLVLAAVCWQCDADRAPSLQPPAVPTGPGDGILFIGNSLTLANDLPGMVQGLAAAAGDKLLTATVAYGGYNLEDHLRRGDAVRSIATRGWRAVVLQQGPSTLPESRRLLREWTATFDQRIRAAGARTALYSVWPDSATGSSFADVAESYSLAAFDVAGIYLPVTDAWVRARAKDGSLGLYSSDGFHPSEQGSYLAALVIVSVFTGRSAVGLPVRLVRPDGHEIAIPPPAAAVLQEAAAEAVSANPP
jgi:hypothetical protein